MNLNEFEIARFQYRFQKKTNYATFFIAFLILGFFFLELHLDALKFSPVLYRMGANYGPAVLQGEYFRLVSSMFLHGSFIHLCMNLYVLYAIGIFFNRILGEGRFLFLFLMSGIGGNVASVVFNHSQLSVGASGALWGMLGASLALSLRPSSFIPNALREELKRLSLVNLGINILISFLPMVDLWGHFGGGITGFVLGYVLFHEKLFLSKWFLSGIILSVFTFLYVAFSVYQQEPWIYKNKVTYKTLYLGQTGFYTEIPLWLSQVKADETGVQIGRLNLDPVQIHFQVLDPLEDLESAMEEIGGNNPFSITKQETFGVETWLLSFRNKKGNLVLVFGQPRQPSSLLIQMEVNKGSSPTLSKVLTHFVSHIKPLDFI